MNIFRQLINEYKSIKKQREVKKNTLLNAESAYTISAINKDTTYDNLYEGYKKQILENIRNKAKYNNIEIYIEHPTWVISDHKAKLFQDLKSLGYNVLYTSDISMIVSWKKD